MPKSQVVTEFGARNGVLVAGVFKTAVVAGGAAGNITVAGCRSPCEA